MEIYRHGKLKDNVFSHSIFDAIVQEPDDSELPDFVAHAMNALSNSFRLLLLDKKLKGEKVVVEREGKIVYLSPEDFPQYHDAVRLREEGKI